MVQQWGDFTAGPYDLRIQGEGVVADRAGSLNLPGREPASLAVQKRFELEGRSLTVEYEISSSGEIEGDVDFGCEVNLHFPSQAECEAGLDGRPFSLAGPVDCGAGSIVTIVDPVLPGPLRLSSSVPGQVWSYPVQTVSQSEGGVDITWQGCSIGFKWKLDFSDATGLALRLSLNF